MAPDARERTIPELLRDLATETSTLVRQEMELLRAELVEKAKPVGASAVSFGGSGLFGLGAFGAGTAFLIAVISLVLPTWAAALIVTAVYGIVALAFVQIGKKKLEEVRSQVAPLTTQTIKDDIAWAKTQVKSDAK